MPNIWLAIPPEMAPGVAGLQLPGMCHGVGCSWNVLAVFVEVAGNNELGNRELLICNSTWLPRTRLQVLPPIPALPAMDQLAEGSWIHPATARILARVFFV